MSGTRAKEVLVIFWGTCRSGYQDVFFLLSLTLQDMAVLNIFAYFSIQVASILMKEFQPCVSYPTIMCILAHIQICWIYYPWTGVLSDDVTAHCWLSSIKCFWHVYTATDIDPEVDDVCNTTVEWICMIHLYYTQDFKLKLLCALYSSVLH